MSCSFVLKRSVSSIVSSTRHQHQHGANWAQKKVVNKMNITVNLLILTTAILWKRVGSGSVLCPSQDDVTNKPVGCVVFKLYFLQTKCLGVEHLTCLPDVFFQTCAVFKREAQSRDAAGLWATCRPRRAAEGSSDQLCIRRWSLPRLCTKCQLNIRNISSHWP